MFHPQAQIHAYLISEKLVSMEELVSAPVAV